MFSLYEDQELFINNIRQSFYGGHRRVVGAIRRDAPLSEI